jgi:RNA polymerase sigma factor (sigma-70 family)
LEQQNKYRDSENYLYSELRSKSRKAFEYLYDNYSAALYGVILNVLREEELSNDSLQEVFVKIWNNFDSYDPQKSRLYTWMLNIARNHAIDRLRSKNIRSGKDPAKDKNYTEQHEQQEAPFIEGIGLRGLVEHLEDEQRAVIDLLYFQGFTQSEAAEELNIPLGTVKSRVRMAIQKLRKYFN